MTDHTQYYVLERQYVGPNQDRHRNTHEYYVTTEPGRTNSSHEVRTTGWLGTTNDWAEYAHGVYESAQAARDATEARLAATGYRETDDLWPRGDEAVARYLVGRDEAWDDESSVTWAYETLRQAVTAATTDQEIEALVETLARAAHDEADAALDQDAVRRYATDLRDRR